MHNLETTLQKKAAIRWLGQIKWTVFGTIKFTDGHNICEKRADTLALKLFNNLDRVYFGRTMVDKGNRIERAVFKHLGSSGENLHFHFLASPQANLEQFCDTAKCVWDELSSHTMGYENTIIESVKNGERALRYSLHEFNTLGCDTLFLKATHFNANSSREKSIHSLRRLLKRDEKNESVIEAALRRAALNAQPK